jgi:hypothetical protein
MVGNHLTASFIPNPKDYSKELLTTFHAKFVNASDAMDAFVSIVLKKKATQWRCCR